MREMDAEEDITYDVDMLKIRNLKIEWLPFLTYGLVDLAGREPYVKEFTLTQKDLGFCVVSSPIYIFIPRIKRIDLSEALVESVGDHFLHMSGDRTKFLHSGPRKSHIEHVMEALSRARIPTVNIYTFGMKSAVQHFLFLDDINAEAAVEIIADAFGNCWIDCMKLVVCSTIPDILPFFKVESGSTRFKLRCW